MRLHDLQVTAFGPFAETVRVDFDELAVDGLFLLSGPTGAGKTSVLDAVCFALYGDVPGERSNAKRLRCDTAAPGLRPRVVLEATLSGRLFRFTRSPSWDRPKKRGSGTTPENAKVLVEERCGEEWSLLTGRIDEAGQLVTDLLGMTMTQFCQVAMLPQGRFQQFLSAGSKERQQLLQQLFATRRFEDIEKWLREHTRSLHRSTTRHHRSVSATFHRMLEAADAAVPDDWPDDVSDDLTSVARSGELSSWARDVLARAETSAQAAQAASEEMTGAAEEARRARAEAGALVDLQRRHATASAALTTLEAESEVHRARQTQLARARKAAPVRPLDEMVRLRTRQRDEAAAEAARASLQSLALLEETGLFDWVEQADSERGLRDLDDTRLHDALAATRDARAHAELMRPLEQELAEHQARISRGRSTRETLAASVSSREQLVEDLPEQIASLTTELAAAREAKALATELTGRLREVDARLDAHARLDEVRAEAETTRADLRDCIDRCQSLKEHWLELREVRLHGMAAEMARDLVVGGCCPVCGSADHPSKAVAEAGSPSAETEKQARALLETQEATRVALDGKVRDLDLRLARLQAEAGSTGSEALCEERERLESERLEAAESGGRVAEFEPTLARLQQSLTRAHRELTSHSNDLAALAAQLQADTDAAEKISAQLAEALAETELDSIAALCDELARAVEVHTETDDLRGSWRAAEGALAEADRVLAAWLAGQGFADAADAVDASLPEAELDQLADRVKTHDDKITAARTSLDEPEVKAAAAADAPDLAALDAAVRRATEESEAHQTRARLTRQQATRLSRLHSQLEEELLAWAPVRDAHDTASELAAFVEGKGQENELRMRLSAYVLAWRLSQVVAAANERLVSMTDQRYTLEHTGRRGAGESRGGLSLLIRDEWSGDARDPATLSGGETFVVSLALALGLADVVTREAGGADLHTLFVDEGFGALDADTLDDVMDTLDGLRDGGRVVGVVSHVGEMRSRIPMQLAVTKDRAGSRVAIRHGAG